jgi:hypothetical protein
MAATATVDGQEARKRRRAALFAIYLRCEGREHLARSSDGGDCRGCGQSRGCRCDRGHAPSVTAHLPGELAPESLETAVEALASDNSEEGVLSARLGLAALCRGADVLEPAELESALRKLDRRLDGGRYEALMRICVDVRDRKQRFLSALNLLLRCQLRNYDVIWQRFPNMVTSIEVSVETTRPIDDFKGGLMDPRQWSQNLPLLWPAAYLVQGTTLPTDRAVDPPENSAPTTDFAGLFYEEAAWPANFLALGLWRNVLLMKYTETANQVHFDFDESECLTSRYLGIDSEGGIDCDKGFGDARKLPDGWTRLAAKKAFRFTKPDLLVVPLNAVSSIWLLFLLEAMVLSGACPI